MAQKVIVFDTNALLDMYQYTYETIDQILDYLNTQSDYDIYISDIVYQEFKNHYQKARSKSGDRNPINRFKKVLENFNNKTISSLKNITDLKLYKGFDTSLGDDLQDLSKNLDSRIKKIISEVDKLYINEDIGFSEDDIVLDFVEQVYSRCNPSKLNFQQKVELASLAEQRIRMKLNPGLTDVKNKQGTELFREYADIFIWFDLLKVAEKYKELIFIENETKIDWWANDNYDSCKENLEIEWNDLFTDTKTFKMIRLEDYLLTYAEDYINSSNQLEISKLKTDFRKALKDNSLFQSNRTTELLYDYAPDDIDHHVLGLSFMYGNVEEVNVFEMLEPEVNLDNVKYDYDSVTRTLFADAEVQVPYNVELLIYFGRDMDYKRYNLTISLTYNCEFEFHVFSQKDLDFILESVVYDNKKAKVSLGDEVLDYEE